MSCRCCAPIGGLPSPVSIVIPVHDKTETDLIAALGTLMAAFKALDDTGDLMGRNRAADWLAAKYGGHR